MGDININMIRNDQNLKPVFYNDKCDKYDYLIAVGCGAIAGLIDIFLVGAPTDSKLQGWTDAQVDKTVMAFAKTCGWSPREGKENSVASAIGFLEKKFPVNYDQRHSGDVGGLFTMSTKNHHMKSLAHSPDIIGLFFSMPCGMNCGKMYCAPTETICPHAFPFPSRRNSSGSKILLLRRR